MAKLPPPRRRRRLPDEPQIPNEEIRYAIGESVLGPVLVASGDRGVVSIQLGYPPEQALHNVQKQLPRGHLVRRDNPKLLKRVIDYIDAPEGVLDVKLDIRGTEFQKKVFAAMREIPAGQTSSYSDIAYKVGAPRAGRAVGTVCATNNLAFAVPCHRVLHKDKSPRTGPHWGHTQLTLLRREGGAPMAKGKLTDLMPARLFADPVRPALNTTHRHLALGDALAGRYPADVAPFATLAEPGAAAMNRLRALLAPKEGVWLFGSDFPAIQGLEPTGQMVLLQMALPLDVAPPPPAAPLDDLAEAQAYEMVALTDIAFPGFFRSRTYRMGSYYGIRALDGTLIAMGGERMKLEDYAEISGVCTHPDFRRRGHAESIIWQVVRQHRREGTRSFLHVSSGNDRAVSLYSRMGFEICREVTVTQFVRSAERERR